MLEVSDLAETRAKEAASREDEDAAALDRRASAPVAAVVVYGQRAVMRQKGSACYFMAMRGLVLTSCAVSPPAGATMRSTNIVADQYRKQKSRKWHDIAIVAGITCSISWLSRLPSFADERRLGFRIGGPS